MVVFVVEVKTENLQLVIQEQKDAGRRILALSPAKILKGIVKSYTLVTQ